MPQRQGPSAKIDARLSTYVLQGAAAWPDHPYGQV